MEEISRAFPHDRKNSFDNRFEEPDLPIGKAGSEESGDLDIKGIPVPMGELYGIMEKPFPEIICPVKPVECPLQPRHKNATC
jgi:hypothetical protein